MSKSINENILEFRKAKGFTQAELGELLGVTNQTVSKWETGLSMPDIMLLPEIAKVLGVSLDDLYGIETLKRSDRCTCADEFPAAVYEEMFKFFFKSTKIRFENIGSTDAEQAEWIKKMLENGEFLGCISNTAGAVYISDSLAFADTSFKAPDSEKVFDPVHVAIALKALSDKKLLRVLEYEYAESFSQSKSTGTELFADDIAKNCNLTDEETEEILGKLIALNLNERGTPKDGKHSYCIVFENMMLVLVIFKLVRSMVDEKVWVILRDTQKISDYAFES